MKGLLVKDMRMLLGQKKFGALIVFMTVVLSFNSDSYFVVYYLTFVCSFLAISSISYDENDNGYPFLFTLPIDRSGYVREKYLFGFILNLCSWLVVDLPWREMSFLLFGRILLCFCWFFLLCLFLICWYFRCCLNSDRRREGS